MRSLWRLEVGAASETAMAGKSMSKRVHVSRTAVAMHNAPWTCDEQAAKSLPSERILHNLRIESPKVHTHLHDEAEPIHVEKQKGALAAVRSMSMKHQMHQ